MLVLTLRFQECLLTNHVTSIPFLVEVLPVVGRVITSIPQLLTLLDDLGTVFLSGSGGDRDRAP